ncbi:MAG: DUF3372 domain-containing protein, partial [Betaproteobacteria bacterium]|nr:DUF3372 domain-containing protein [Betaproteobacteria bacterium]
MNRPPRPFARYLWATIFALIGSITAPAASATDLQAACARTDFQTILQPDTGSAEARAYWLDRQWLQWPGAAPSGVFKLYHAARGGIAAQPGQRVAGADGALALTLTPTTLPTALSERFKFIGRGAVLSLSNPTREALTPLLQQQLMLVQEDDQGIVQAATGVQLAGVLDDLYAAAESVADLGVTLSTQSTLSTQPASTRFKLWAPTARQVALCLYPSDAAPSVNAMRFDPATGIWAATLPRHRRGNSYRYLVEVFVPGVGLVLNAVTDPYSISLNADSKRSTIADLDDASLAPPGWRQDAAPLRVKTATDMTIYELHVRDFSINDATVPRAHRGKYLAFTHRQSAGMRHLAALSQAGLTDVHLLPVFDIATIPETGCVTPAISGDADSEQQQAIVSRLAAQDCFNWGYDPFHFNAPEGSYATDGADGTRRIIEFRRMVMALHQAGLRVGMDVVYNHTAAFGQHAKSVLDRIVPGYYHRRNALGAVEQSTCCANTATEHRMMGKLMIDSAALWVRAYHIDSFRFDLMGHQPRAAMEKLQARVNQAAGRLVPLIGEGWNFGEVADGAHFVQASQLSLNGSGIGTFSDRARDALRGGGPADNNDSLQQAQGYINGLVYA